MNYILYVAMYAYYHTRSQAHIHKNAYTRVKTVDVQTCKPEHIEHTHRNTYYDAPRRKHTRALRTHAHIWSIARKYTRKNSHRHIHTTYYVCRYMDLCILPSCLQAV